MRNAIVSFIVITVLLCACEGTELPRNEEQLVVEGYIDDGGFPVVILTTTMPVNTESMAFDSLEKHMLRWAKVTVSEGNQEVVLTGMADRSYIPPFVYTTSRMRGKSGKEYRLNVEYKGMKAQAVTTIPPRPVVDSFKVENAGPDSLFKITVCFSDPPTERNYYKCFMRRGRHGKQWLSCYLGLVSDEVLNGYTEIPVNQGELATDKGRYSPYFKSNDTVTIKFAQIDEAAYHFWNDYENSNSFGRNPLFPYAYSLRSNIEGGIGCWYGCGAVTRSFIIEP